MSISDLYNKYFLLLINKASENNSFPNIIALKHGQNDNYITFSHEGFKYNFVSVSERTRGTYGQNFVGFTVELYLNQEYFDSYFEQLKLHRNTIEKEIGIPITWQEAEFTSSKNVCRIYALLDGNLEDTSKWNNCIQWQIETMSKFLNVLPKFTKTVSKISIGVLKMTAEEREKAYKNWAVATVKNESTIENYIKSLNEDFHQKLGTMSLFENYDLEYLNTLYKRCGKGGDLYEWSDSIGNGRPKSAVGKYIEFLENYSIRTDNQNNISKDDFERNMENLYQKTPSKESGKCFILKTSSQGKPFRLFKNSANSFVAKPYTENATEMHISKTQLLNAKYENKNYVYESYEQVIIDLITKGVVPEIKECKETQPNDSKIKNILLYGVPGVGKTHNIAKLISLIEEGRNEYEVFQEIEKNTLLNNNAIDVTLNERIRFVTFHQNFGYEDFIEGFRPNEKGTIELQQGIFKSICEEAKKNEDKKYYLVIDEINRGNISKIFGELITLIEEDKRDSIKVVLPYSKLPFTIPSNLFIIGTMNSTDKSIALIDIALRRRFTFVKMQPNDKLINHVESQELFNKLNVKITERLGEDYQIGHSYFMKIENDADLSFVIKYKITPLLEEYFYGDTDGLNDVLKVFEK